MRRRLFQSSHSQLCGNAKGYVVNVLSKQLRRSITSLMSTTEIITRASGSKKSSDPKICWGVHLVSTNLFASFFSSVSMKPSPFSLEDPSWLRSHCPGKSIRKSICPRQIQLSNKIWNSRAVSLLSYFVGLLASEHALAAASGV